MRTPLKKAATAMALAAAAFTAQFVSAAPASAHPGADGYCGYREVCVYRLANYIDMWADFFNADNDFSDDNLWFWDGVTYVRGSEMADNRASSVQNFDTGCSAILWQLKEAGGINQVVYPSAALPNLANQGFDNKASSLSWSC
ncbi:hypothetical protein [Nonomuraea sp. NPDC050786]|uniref:hypothetical protein n=1 Tax=Nonomuraea sp. NPDC050786 TaxID=3154840 RepID=UPI0033DEC492